MSARGAHRRRTLSAGSLVAAALAAASCTDERSGAQRQREQRQTWLDSALMAMATPAPARSRTEPARDSTFGARAESTPLAAAPPLPAIESTVISGSSSTLVIVVEREVLWVGDTARLGAVLMDADGSSTPVPATQWRTSSPDVLDLGEKLAVALFPGEATLHAFASGTRASVQLTVLPRVRGRLLSASGLPVDGARVHIRHGPQQHSAVSDVHGRFDWRVPQGDAVAVSLEVLAAGHHAARFSVAPAHAAGELRVALIPAEWRITTGRFAGRTVRVDPENALPRVSGGSSFARVERDPRVPGTRLVGWPPHELPLSLRLSANQFTSEDSIAVWAAVDRLHRNLGMQLFRPAPAAHPDTPGAQVTVLLEPDLERPALTIASWSSTGRLSAASVHVRSRAAVRSGGLIMHELLHAVGFGHTAAWPSVMRTPGGGELDAPTLQDVAHTQLFLRLVALQFQERTAIGFVEAATSPTP